MRTTTYRSARKLFDQLTEGEWSIERDVEAANRALEICPEYVEAWVRLGESWLFRDPEEDAPPDWERSHAEKALTYFEQALEIEPLSRGPLGR